MLNLLQDPKNQGKTMYMIWDGEMYNPLQYPQQRNRELPFLTLLPLPLEPDPNFTMPKKINLTPPDSSERQTILAKYLASFFTEQEINEFFTGEILKDIVEQTEGFTGRLLLKMLQNIKKASKEDVLTKELISATVEKFILENKPT
jgi:hypothetical protein